MKFLPIYIFLSWIIFSHDSYSQADSNYIIKRFHLIDSLSNVYEFNKVALIYHELEFMENNIKKANYYKLMRYELEKKSNKYDKALEILGQFDKNSCEDTLNEYIKFQTSFLYYLSDNLDFAEIKISEMLYEFNNPKYFWLPSLIYFEKGKYNLAKKYSSEFLEFKYKNDTLLKKIYLHKSDSLISVAEKIKMKNPKKAAKLSALFPGLGMIYTKNYNEAATSIFLTSVILTGMVIGFINQYYITSFMTGMFLFSKFYSGIITRSEYLAKKHNYKLTLKLKQEFNALIIK